MNVIDIIKMVGRLSSGNLTDIDQLKEDVLPLLNLVHAELYRKCAQGMFSRLLQPIYLMATPGQNYADFPKLGPLGYRIFSVNSFSIAPSLNYPSPPMVKEIDLLRMLTERLGGQYFYAIQDLPTVTRFYFSSAIANTNNQFIAFVIPGFTPFTIDTLESEIPYIPEYHQVLVDEVLYYIFQGEGGVKNNILTSESIRRAELRKNEMIAYYVNASKIPLTTFSTV